MLTLIFSVGVWASSQANHKISMLTQVNRIIKYISGLSAYGLLYSFDTNPFLVEYCDTDWGGSEDRKSTFGWCYFIGNNLIFWFSKILNYVSTSSAQA